MKKTILTVLSGLAVVAASALTSTAADTKVVATGLDNPTGIAVQPETGHLLVASHAGIVRVDPKTGKVTPEVVGNPTDVYGKGPKYNIGPLGIAFMGNNHIVVGGGSRPDGEELVHVYKIGNEAAKEPQKESDAVYTLGPIKAGEQSIKGEGNFYGVAVTEKAIYVTCNGDDTKGWVARAILKDGKPGKLKPFIATKEATEVDAPAPISLSKTGKGLIVGQKGEVNQPGDSLLTAYSQGGKLTKKVETGLNDIVGIAFSPDGKLYVTDFSWIAPENGGLFRASLGKKDATSVKPKKITSLDKPTGIAFGKDGTAYIAVFGTAGDDGKPAGEVVAVSGL